MPASISFAVPGPLDLPTGGYGYDRQLIAELRTLGHAVDVLTLAPDFPTPSDADIDAALGALAEVPAGRVQIVDGLAFGALPAERLRPNGPLVALVHHPLALETGLDAATARALHRTEEAALERADAVIVTSPTTARTLIERFAVNEEAITVAVPGLDPDWFALERRSGAGDIAEIVCVGSLTPRKGHDILLAALARLPRGAWRATIVGSDTLSPSTAQSLAEMAARLGIADRVRFAGAASREAIAELFARADVFALATRYEGYGMVFAEAMAAGLPIVATRGGAVADLVPDEAGLLSSVDDVDALAASLLRMVDDRAFAARCGAAGRTFARSLPSWPQTAARVSELVERLAR